jgi:2-C-methyl-D-erythritol 4-phosphate cytidylyltransferase
MQKLSLIIPAAGSGVRLGSDIPKPFIEIGGKTILEITLSRFIHLPNLIQVVVACSVELQPKVQQLKSSLPEKVEFVVVKGGDERQLSIYNALHEVSDEAEIVAIHDAVRPFIKTTLIQNCCKVASEVGGAVIGIPAKDTIKKVDKTGKVTATPNRSDLWQAQTPQIFRKKILIEAYRSAMDSGFMGTDDASLVENVGGLVQMVKGDQENFKITYPIDLEMAKLILAKES